MSTLNFLAPEKDGYKTDDITFKWHSLSFATPEKTRHSVYTVTREEKMKDGYDYLTTYIATVHFRAHQIFLNLLPETQKSLSMPEARFSIQDLSGYSDKAREGFSIHFQKDNISFTPDADPLFEFPITSFKPPHVDLIESNLESS